MTPLIAIVDDELDILELVSLQLRKAGFQTRMFSMAHSFYKYLETNIPDLVILDLMLPDADGLEVCKYLKNNQRTGFVPVVMLTAKAEETDKIVGLELGADDYITKPFSPQELTARVKAVLRRVKNTEAVKIIRIGKNVLLDPEKYEVTVSGEKADLTTTEFKILAILAGKKGIVFSREKLLNALWGSEKAVLDRTIDVHVRNLREKLGPAGDLIVNVRGVGYKLTA